MYTIGDFLIRIKNGYLARKERIECPYTKVCDRLASLLVENHFLKDVEVKEKQGGKKILVLSLNYRKNILPAVSGVKIISKPGRRFYVTVKEIPWVKEGKGITIISTSKGLMTGLDAIKAKLGGEVICQIWR